MLRNTCWKTNLRREVVRLIRTSRDQRESSSRDGAIRLKTRGYGCLGRNEGAFMTARSYRSSVGVSHQQPTRQGSVISDAGLRESALQLASSVTSSARSTVTSLRGIPLTSSIRSFMTSHSRTLMTSSTKSVETSSTASSVTSSASASAPNTCLRENLHCVPRVGRDGLVESSSLTATTLVEARLDDERRVARLEWNDGEVTEYPYMWLRDCCQCDLCFDEGPCGRRLIVTEVDLNVKPTSIQADGTIQQIELLWSDGHRSVYRYKWLQDRSFTPDRQAKRARWNGRTSQHLWDSSFINNLPTLSFNKLLNDKKTQYEWATLLEDVGFVLLKGAPLEMGQLQKIGHEIGFMRMTNYGDTSKVQMKSNPSNLAFTSGTLNLHTDLAYYMSLPGMQMMHCIEQTSGEGGQSLFVDGFLVAKQLREQSPEQFKLLTETIFDFFDIGSDFLDFHQMSRHPTIKLDEEGNVMRIAFSTHSRDSFLRVPLESVESVYQALQAFTRLLYDPRNLVELKLQPGDVCCFNNWRILHGRIGYESRSGDTRFLEQGYIDWDEMHSRRRVLKVQLGIPDEEY